MCLTQFKMKLSNFLSHTIWFVTLDIFPKLNPPPPNFLIRIKFEPGTLTRETL